MRKRKRLIALLLTFIMVFTFIPSINSKADDDNWHISVTGNASVTTESKTATWNLNINNVQKQVTLRVVLDGDVSEGQFVMGSDGSFLIGGDWDPNTMEVVYYDNSVQNPEAVPALVELPGPGSYSLGVRPADADPLPKNISIEVREKAKSKLTFERAESIEFENNTATVTYKNAQNQDVDVTVTPGQDTALVMVQEDLLNGETVIGHRNVLYAYGDTVNFAFDEAPNNASYYVFTDGVRADEPVGLNVENLAATLATEAGEDYELNLDFGGNGGGGGGNNNNESKIVFRNIDQIAFNEDTSTATITYKDAQEQDVTVTVAPALGTTLEKRADPIRNGEDIIGYRDVLYTEGGDVDIAFTAEPLSANYTQFINGQPQTEQPENFEINNNETSLTTVEGSEYEVSLDFAGNGGGGGQQQGRSATLTFVNPYSYSPDACVVTYNLGDDENSKFVNVKINKGENDTLVSDGGDYVLNIENNNDVSFTISNNFDPQNMTISVSGSGNWSTQLAVEYDNDNNNYTASLAGLNFPGDGNIALSITNGNNGGNNPPHAGNKTARILISGMDYNNSPTWTGIPGAGHEEITTYYDKYWFSTQFSIKGGSEYPETTQRWDMFNWEDNYSDEQFADATETYGNQTIHFDRADDATTVDINVFVGNWGDRIDAIEINGTDYSDQLHLDGDPAKPNIFDDEASMLRLFKDQGICITIEGVPVNHSDEDGIDDEYAIRIAASPNEHCFIGNFLWSQDDYYAPIEMGGIEPSDKYIGKSTLTLMDIYYQDGTFDPSVEPENKDGFFELDDGWYKHIAVPENEKEYTNEEMPAIHYQLDRRGWNPETQSESGPSNSEMVMPTGTWVKMKIQPEQGYQVESFSGVNRNAGNVKILSDEADDACIFMFKIDSGNFHIGANVVPYENTADTEKSEAVSAASVDLEAGTLDGGTGELSVEDIQINEQDAAPYKDALAGVADDYSIEAGLDLSLNEIYLKGGVQDKDSDAAWRTEVGNTAAGLAEPAEITLQLDDDIVLSGKDVQIVHKNTHVNNGTETRYEGVMITGYDPETNAISFEAPSFSDYAILTKEAAVPEGNKAKLRINTTLGVMSNDQAVFTYKDGDETVGVVHTDEVVALEAEKDDKNNVVSQFMYTTNPGDSGVSFILEPANEYYKPQVLENGEWVDIELTFIPRLFSAYVYDAKGYTLTPDGTPVTDVQFRFVCTRTYDISFAEPTLTVGEGEEAITADVVGIEGFDEALTGGKVAKDTNIAGLGAKNNITLSGFDPERMVVRITAAGTTGWAKVLNPIPVDDNYVVSLGMLVVPEGSTGLVFSIIEKTNDQPGPDGGEGSDDAVLAFPESSQITFNENTSTATVTYINNQGEDVAVTVKPAEGTMLYKRADPIFDDQGTGEQPPEPVGYVDVLVTNGGQLTFEFSEEPLYAGYYMDDDSRDKNPRGIDINNKTATFATEKGHAYEVCLDFGGNGGFDYGDDARIRFHGAVDIKKNETTGAVTVTYLDDDDDEVYVTITAAEGVIDAVNVNNWYDEENDEEGTDYELYTTGGRLRIVFPNEPEHTFAFWSPVVEGQPGDPVDFVFDNFATTLDTELRVEYDVDISFRHEPEPPEPPHSDGTIKTNGIYCASNYPTIQAGISIEKSNPDDDVEYRWLAIDANNPVKWFEVSPWKLNNNWMSWTPEKSGSYVFVCYARVVGNEEESLIQSAFGTEYHKAIKAICQMPYDGGFLVGIESRDNPNNSYKYEMLVLDCNLLVQGDPNPWIYSTGKCGSLDNSLWTLWKPVYGYYWTLFRIYDANDNLIDEICYGFTNAN